MLGVVRRWTWQAFENRVEHNARDENSRQGQLQDGFNGYASAAYIYSIPRTSLIFFGTLSVFAFVEAACYIPSPPKAYGRGKSAIKNMAIKWMRNVSHSIKKSDVSIFNSFSSRPTACYSKILKARVSVCYIII